MTSDILNKLMQTDRDIQPQKEVQEYKMEEELCSEIVLKVANSKLDEEAISFKLETKTTGHFIKLMEASTDLTELSLRDNDRLLAINGNLVMSWNHLIVLESLKYTLYFSEPYENISLIIDRQDSDGTLNIYEISIIATSKGKTDKALDDIEIDSGDVYLEIKSYLKRITYIPRMRSIKFKQLYQCRIRHGARTNCYLKINEQMKLVIEKLVNEDEDLWKFDCYLYHGLQISTKPTTAPSSVFICVLRSCHSFNDQRPYICATTIENVEATLCETLTLDDREKESTDCRFFRLSRASNGMNLLESLIFKGYYLTWNNLSNKPSLTKHTDEEISSNAESLTSCYFEILSDGVLDIK